jgi:hypothetical protein
MAVRLFVSYRRSDSRYATGRLRDRLASEFGRENVFYDVDSISFGVDFRTVISRTIEEVDVLIVVIGRNFDLARLAQYDDHVHVELLEAFRLDKRVVPVLVDDAAMPTPLELPPDLVSLAYRNAAPLRPDPDFDSDAERLVHALRSASEPPTVAAELPGVETPVTPLPDPAVPGPSTGSRQRRRGGVGLAITLGAIGVLAVAGLAFALSSSGGNSPATTVATSVAPTATTSPSTTSVASTSASATSTATVPTSTASTVATTASPTITTTPTSAPVASSPPTRPTVRARVVHTCGASGHGDCFLSLRTQPTSTAPEAGRVYEGAVVEVVCQVHGQRVSGSAAGTGDVWAKTSFGTYVANIYLEGEGIDPTSVTIPCES